MTGVKITKRMVLEAMIEVANGNDLTDDLTWDDVRNYAMNEISLLDKRAVKAKERAEKNKAETDELMEIVYEAMNDDFEPIADIAARIEGEDVTVGKVGARLRKLVEAGRAEKAELKVKREGEKTRTLVGYKRV